MLNSNKIKNPSLVEKVVLTSDKNGTLELTSTDNLTWNGIVPSTWNEQDTFAVSMTYGKDIQLWQGLLNTGTSSLTSTRTSTFDLTGETVYVKWDNDDNTYVVKDSTKENLVEDTKAIVKAFTSDTIVFDNCTLEITAQNGAVVYMYNVSMVLYRQIKYIKDDIAYCMYSNNTGQSAYSIGDLFNISIGTSF